MSVIRALARKPSGLTRNELVAATGVPSGGNMTSILMELETSGFICRMTPFGRAERDSAYRLIDQLTLFHLRWLAGKNLRTGGGDWAQIHATPAWYAWSGYAFENLCLNQISEIKKALGIAGVQTETSSWRHLPVNSQDRGAQIDLVIDRRDGVVNLCEMKFGEDDFAIDKKYAGELRNKVRTFRRVTRTRKALFLTFVTPYGVKANDYQAELVQNSITADVLFDA